jgi:hypothetical protein
MVVIALAAEAAERHRLRVCDKWVPLPTRTGAQGRRLSSTTREKEAEHACA